MSQIFENSARQAHRGEHRVAVRRGRRVPQERPRGLLGRGAVAARGGAVDATNRGNPNTRVDFQFSEFMQQQLLQHSIEERSESFDTFSNTESIRFTKFATLD